MWKRMTSEIGPTPFKLEKKAPHLAALRMLKGMTFEIF
jgi:hypothetical protein